jgi:hypothetical protein
MIYVKNSVGCFRPHLWQDILSALMFILFWNSYLSFVSSHLVACTAHHYFTVHHCTILFWCHITLSYTIVTLCVSLSTHKCCILLLDSWSHSAEWLLLSDWLSLKAPHTFIQVKSFSNLLAGSCWTLVSLVTWITGGDCVSLNSGVSKTLPPPIVQATMYVQHFRAPVHGERCSLRITSCSLFMILFQFNTCCSMHINLHDSTNFMTIVSTFHFALLSTFWA